MTVPEVLDRPDLSSEPNTAQDQPDIFHACVVTRAQSKKDGPDLFDSFMVAEQFPEAITFKSGSKSETKETRVPLANTLPQKVLHLPVSREEFITAQKDDVTLSKCHSSVLSQQDIKNKLAYFCDGGLLMQRWTGEVLDGTEWSAVYQVVVHTAYRSQVLFLAHDHPWSGHLGITKTYNRVLKHFFWPGL